MWRRPSGRSSAEPAWRPRGAVRVVVAGEHEHRTFQAPELRGVRHRWQRQVVGAQRHAEQREGGDPAVVQRLAQGDARAERPATGHRRKVGGLLADPRDGRTCVTDLVAATAVRAARAHHAAEVEQQDGEAADPGELVAQGPHDRVVLAATVLGMGVAQDRRSPEGRASGRRSSPSIRRPSSVVNVTGSTVCDDGSRGRVATTSRVRHRVRRAGRVAVAGLHPARRASATSSGTGRCSCPRSPGATRSRHSRVSRTRPLACCSAPASCR